MAISFSSDRVTIVTANTHVPGGLYINFHRTTGDVGLITLYFEDTPEGRAKAKALAAAINGVAE